MLVANTPAYFASEKEKKFYNTERNQSFYLANQSIIEK
jgi:hypothetical protein